MPFYEYECSECSHEFEEFKTIAKYDEPLKEPCPSCFHVGYIARLISNLLYLNLEQIRVF